LTSRTEHFVRLFYLAQPPGTFCAVFYLAQPHGTFRAVFYLAQPHGTFRAVFYLATNRKAWTLFLLRFKIGFRERFEI